MSVLHGAVSKQKVLLCVYSSVPLLTVCHTASISDAVSVSALSPRFNVLQHFYCSSSCCQQLDGGGDTEEQVPQVDAGGGVEQQQSLGSRQLAG